MKMSRIFITGSSDGLGSMAAKNLVQRGHKVILHARNETRAKDAENACPGAEAVLIGDLSSITDTKNLAAAANKLGTFDAVIHNAGLYHGGFQKTPEGLPALVAVNTLAPYILTCLMNKPKRLVYLSSGMHGGGDGTLKDIDWKQRGERGWNDTTGYSESKLHDIMLANAFARRFKNIGVISNSLDPGWIPTKMGGSSAPGDGKLSVATYTMLALGEGLKDTDTGKYWYNCKQRSPRPEALDESKQDALLKRCEELTGVKVPVQKGEL